MLVWDETGARNYETGVSRGIFFPIDGSPGVPWNGLVGVTMDPQGGDLESYWFDGVKYMDRTLAEDFQATIQAISTPKEFEKAEGVRPIEGSFGGKTHFNKRDKFHMAWRTEIGNDQTPNAAYKIHILYNALVQPSSRAYQTISDNTTPDIRSFVITATAACFKQAYFVFDSREGDLSLLEAQLNVGVLPKCWDLPALTGAPGGGGGTPEGDPDFGCKSLLTDLEQFVHGQVVSTDTTDAEADTSSLVYGIINNGLDIIELPAAGAFAANDSAASEVGTHPVLVDDDDATYVTSAQGDLGYTIGLPPLVGYVEGCALELHIRASISGGVNPDDPDNVDADMQVHISTDAAGDVTIGGFSDGADEGMGFSLSVVDGTPVDYVVPLSMDAWVDSTIDDVVTALSAGAYLNVVGATNNNTDTTPEVRVYEAKIVMLNDVDPEKFLRAVDPTDYCQIVNNIYDGTGTDTSLDAALSNYIDFKVTQVVQSSDAVGDNKDLMAFTDTVGGYLAELELCLDSSIGDYPMVKWHWGGAALWHEEIELNKWYRFRLDWGWTSYTVNLSERETGAIVHDESNANSETPWTQCNNYGGFVGDADTTYEVVIDNAKMQIHCHDDPPPPPMIIELPAWHCNDPGGSDFANPARFTTKDDSGDWDMLGRLGVGYFAETDHGAVVPGEWIYMPSTPSGYALTRATYVVRAYRMGDNGTYTGTPFSNYTPGTNLASPYLNAESSATIDNYAIQPLSVGSFSEIEWVGDEVLSRLTNPPGSQAPCLRLWPEDSMPPYDGSTHIHVSYYAVRLYYDPI